MTTQLTVTALEDSTYVVTASFTDEDESAVVPNSIEWSLKDSAGNVVNERSAVEIAVPASSIEIVLSGDDLDPGDGEDTYLMLTITANYDSSLGLGLPLIGECVLSLSALHP